VQREYYTVIEPVTNLRKAPQEGASSYDRDDLLLSQLLFGEKLFLNDESCGWAFVEAVEQQTFRTHGRWEGYSGWVRKESICPCPADQDRTTDAVIKTRTAPVLAAPEEGGEIFFELSVGTRIALGEVSAETDRFCPVRLPQGNSGWINKDRLRLVAHESAKDRSRQNILATAMLFLDVPYLWGGRSMHMPGLKAIATGVDCSGLTNLVYRAHDIHIPRDAYEQWLKADPLPVRRLEPCDLVFVARGESAVSHVMLFAGGGSFIEAHETGANVRMSTFRERFGIDLSEITGERNRARLEDDREISFGRVLP
jgi:gamma-D-glutamyl-L-lysine dipeptidyl-peptidase